ncbi:MAG TPA: guanine deaminase [Burkholderiaceae bacterium]|nr:guanine deaminase [Burkholderiaceae bacterium]
MQAYRAKILYFVNDKAPSHSARLEEDGLLVIGSNHKSKQVVLAVGSYQRLITDFRDQHPDLLIQHLPDRIIAPGFVDMHIHYPQTDVIGSPADGLLPWLENYTFPEEKQYVDGEYAANTALFFIAELFRNGVTTALTFATSHVASVNALFEVAQTKNMRLITGKCLQDRNCPDGVRDQTEQSLADTEALIQHWHGVDRLGYAITPRFVPTCSDAQLRGAGELAAKYADVWIQSHVAENVDEIRWVKELYPTSRSYLEVYHDFGLMRNKAVYAHGIYLDAADRTLMARTGAAIAVSPTSNLFLGSGFFDYSAADAAKFAYGLASDVGGGTSFSPFHTMMAAYYVGRATVQQGGNLKAGLSLSPQHLWWQHTMGAAKGLGLEGVVGNLTVGCEADFVILNPQCTPLMARKMERCSNLDELLFAMIVLGDDRLIEKTVIAGQTQFQRSGI